MVGSKTSHFQIARVKTQDSASIEIPDNVLFYCKTESELSKQTIWYQEVLHFIHKQQQKQKKTYFLNIKNECVNADDVMFDRKLLNQSMFGCKSFYSEW